MYSIVNSLMSDYIGLSTDTKPTTGVANGSHFYEMDTAKDYYFDAESKAWVTASS